MRHLPAFTIAMVLFAGPVEAAGLDSGQRFEGWIPLPMTASQARSGMMMHPGDRIRITFPHAFRPVPGKPAAFFLYGWTQGQPRMGFRASLSSGDPRTIDITIDSGIDSVSAAMPGVKAIHLSVPLLNPEPGAYPISIATTIAGKRASSKTRIDISAAP